MNNTIYDQVDPLPYRFTIKKEFSNELKWHQDFSMFFILKGEVNVNIKNRGHLFNKNDIYFLEPYNSFSIIATSPDAKVLHLVINLSFIKTMVADFDQITYKTNYLRYSKSSIEHEKLSKNIGHIILHSLKKGSCENLKSVSATANLLSDLIEIFGEKKQKGQTQPDYVQERIHDIISYINTNYREKIMLEDISDYLGIHPQYFSSFFSKHFNKSFIKFLTNYRIQRSITQLITTDDAILDIAVENGFNNHKTYSLAFKKTLGVSPTQYREEYKEITTSKSEDTNPQSEIFNFFQQFWNTENDNSNQQKENTIHQHISLNIDFVNGNYDTFYNDRPLFIDVGRASSCLRNEIQEQIEDAKNELGFNYIRFRDIFSDDLFVYHEESDRVPQFNWQYIDIIHDFLSSLNIKPFIEIGFMPRHLASKKQYVGWNFHPNVSYPKSIEKWKLLITKYMQHCISRYGLSEVQTWLFDFWVCPDLDVKDGYWNESMEKFFQFYHATYDAIKSVNNSLKLGSPNFTAEHGIDWYENFFEYCIINEIKPAYVSVHVYGSDLIKNSHDFLSYTTREEDLPPTPDKTHVSKQLDVLQTLMNEKGFGDLDIIASNWNISYYPKDLVRDTAFMGPYFAYIQVTTMKKTLGMCLRSLSDVNEDFFPHSSLFHGGSGMVDFYGLKKAIYYTYYFYTKLGKTIIDTSDYYIVAKSENGYQIMIYNLVFFDSLYRSSDHSALTYNQRYNIFESSETLNAHLMLTLKSGKYSIKKSMVNRHSGSAYDIWRNIGSPENLDSSLVEYIKNKSIPETIYSTEDVSSNLIIDTLVEPHEVILFEIEPVL